MRRPPPAPVHGPAPAGADAAPVPWHRRPALWWGLFALWNTALFWLSSLGGDELPPMPLIPHLDKAEHAGFFAVGFGLFTVALGLTVAPNSGGRRGWLVVLAILAATVCGGLDEYHQTFTPHRFGLDVGDWVADIAGAALGALLAGRWLRASTPPRPAAGTAGSAVGPDPMPDQASTEGP